MKILNYTMDNNNTNKYLLVLFALMLSLITVFTACSSQVKKNQDIIQILNEYSASYNEDFNIEEPPQIIKLIEPIYPKKARKTGLTGVVWLKVLVGEWGYVSEVEILKDSGAKDAGFEEAAINAAYKTRWKPAIVDGKTIAVWIAYKITFDFR